MCTVHKVYSNPKSRHSSQRVEQTLSLGAVDYKVGQATVQETGWLHLRQDVILILILADFLQLPVKQRPRVGHIPQQHKCYNPTASVFHRDHSHPPMHSSYTLSVSDILQ